MFLECPTVNFHYIVLSLELSFHVSSIGLVIDYFVERLLLQSSIIETNV